jgi:hypothetical protein
MSRYRHYDPAANPDDEGYRSSAKPPTGLARRRLRDPQIAAERGQILGAQRLTHALENIEFVQRELRDVGQRLQAVLSMRPLAQAYARFQTEGGVTAVDWRDWLQGMRLHGRCWQPTSKQHLRIAASNKDKPSTHKRHGDGDAA